MDKEVKPNTEAVHKDTATKTEWQYYDEHSKPVHLSKVVHKDQPMIRIYPFSYSRERGLTRKKIRTIELRGWRDIKDVPTSLRSGEKIKLTTGAPKYLMSFLYKIFPKLEKLIVVKSGSSRFGEKSITFSYQDFEKVVKAVGKEIRSYEIRRKTAIANSLSEITSRVQSRKTKLSKGSLAHYLSFYSDDFPLSSEDLDAILSVLSLAPAANISVTENFIQTKDKINVAYLDEVIDKFESLLRVKRDNEKEWQEFFERHGWILANLFPFQVVLREREAYVGGKTISNKEGRVVDFLFQNGFNDNYALLEIKTHNKSLLKRTPYREPDTYAVHDDLSGAISQCLDQKNIFLTDMGRNYSVLDPKVILISGNKGKLNDSQCKCFELIRANQKNVDIVTFDELLLKIKGLKDILKS